MSQLALFRDSAQSVPKLERISNSKDKLNSQQKQFTPKQSKTKQIASHSVQKTEIHPEATSNSIAAPWGYCRSCGSPISISGLDASLCSNPAKTCGSSGWVVDPIWLAANPPRNKGGAA